jgi:hypothetical protein
MNCKRRKTYEAWPAEACTSAMSSRQAELPALAGQDRHKPIASRVQNASLKVKQYIQGDISNQTVVEQ